jgi:hypothetical protein
MQLIREMVAISETNEELAFIGAGMLEDLLRRQGPAAIADTEQAAATDPRFRFALAGVWPNEMFPEVWARVAVALAEQQRY